jgi:nitronate monooxygenase
MSRFTVHDLRLPVIAAPMAGGPSTPELVAAVSNTGGLGFLAGGFTTAQKLAESLAAARALTSGPLGVNVFVPQPTPTNTAELKGYAAALAGEAEHYGVALGEPRYSDDDWDAKLEVVHDLKPELVSFTFGLPGADELARIKGAGITVVAGVTSLEEALAAADRGFDALVVQGPKAGGHSFVFDGHAPAPTQSLEDLLASITGRCRLPVIAAGGLATAADLNRALQAGAVAGQFGTAFLLADEAGTKAVHRSALTDPAFAETSVTRAFTGRYARGLRNRFIDEHDHQAVAGFLTFSIWPVQCWPRRPQAAIHRAPASGPAPGSGRHPPRRRQTSWPDWFMRTAHCSVPRLKTSPLAAEPRSPIGAAPRRASRAPSE